MGVSNEELSLWAVRIRTGIIEVKYHNNGYITEAISSSAILQFFLSERLKFKLFEEAVCKYNVKEHQKVC